MAVREQVRHFVAVATPTNMTAGFEQMHPLRPGLTVGKLREIMSDLPDDMPVVNRDGELRTAFTVLWEERDKDTHVLVIEM